MQASLKTSFAQISRAAQKIWVAQNLGGLQPRPVRLWASPSILLAKEKANFIELIVLALLTNNSKSCLK